MNYFPVHCKKGAELKAERRLNEQFKGRCHCPVRINLKKEKVALWDCYVLLQLELGEDDISAIKNTPGVSGGLLRFGDHYPTIPNEIAKAAIGQPMPYEQAKQIRVLSGLYKDWILNLESANEEQLIAWVMFLDKLHLVKFKHDNVVLI